LLLWQNEGILSLRKYIRKLRMQFFFTKDLFRMIVQPTLTLMDSRIISLIRFTFESSLFKPIFLKENISISFLRFTYLLLFEYFGGALNGPFLISFLPSLIHFLAFSSKQQLISICNGLKLLNILLRFTRHLYSLCDCFYWGLETQRKGHPLLLHIRTWWKIISHYSYFLIIPLADRN
jgi:hypothetical protein